MNAIWFMLGALTTCILEIVACIAYAVVSTNKGGRK